MKVMEKNGLTTYVILARATEDSLLLKDFLFLLKVIATPYESMKLSPIQQMFG